MDDATAEYQILPPTLEITPTKSFFADGNGNYQTDAGEHAVIGEGSGVSMVINAANASAFPISHVVITEPGHRRPRPASGEVRRLVDPPDAPDRCSQRQRRHHLLLRLHDRRPTTPRPARRRSTSTRRRAVTSITVTYTGDPAVDGGKTIQPGSTAGLGVHGNLNDLVDGSDIRVRRRPRRHRQLRRRRRHRHAVSGRDRHGVRLGMRGASHRVGECRARVGPRTRRRAELPVHQPVVFTMTTTNNGNLPLVDLVVADPTTQADGTPPTPDINSVWYWASSSVPRCPRWRWPPV